MSHAVRPWFGWVGLAWLAIGLTAAAQPPDPFARFDLPDAWEAEFWANPAVKELLAREPKAIAALVPVQAGIRHARCPACGAAESVDALSWSISKPDVVACRLCQASFPNDKVPAKDANGKVPEEELEVLPGVVHKYPYHALEPLKQTYPDERVYLAAKRDYEMRAWLSKAALYAAVRHHEQPTAGRDPALARLAAVLILRFAQVYPAYATHYDQPGEPKFFQGANLRPPYRAAYRTAKWDWTASLEVPLNLVIAYALVRNDPAIAEAGTLLGDARPSRTIERDLFRASARFVMEQTPDDSEATLLANRGLLAVGRLLGDPDLVHAAVDRLGVFGERGFYHDGLWREADAASHRRVVAVINGWIDRLLAGYSDPPGYRPARGAPFSKLPGAAVFPQMALARAATAAAVADPRFQEVRQAAWPAVDAPEPRRQPTLLGGAGVVRLAVGEGPQALDLELRGTGEFGRSRTNRLALRLAVGGRPMLGDLDDLPPLPSGWDRASVCHNTVLIDGLNQRETVELAKQPAPGADIFFFAAAPDFQVAVLEDRFAYPLSATRYRQTVVASGTPGTPYAVSLFEVEGGLRHDQAYHAAPGVAGRWRTASRLAAGPRSLLPPSITYIPEARAGDGRWFLQSYGDLGDLRRGPVDRPIQAILQGPGGPGGVRLHLLGDLPAVAITASSVDPSAGTGEASRASLILRRESQRGETLRSRFMTVFEPVAPAPVLKRVGRVESPPGSLVLLIETARGHEHLVFNVGEPGSTQTLRLSDGSTLKTDGVAVRVSASGEILLAGGTFAQVGQREVRQPRASGRIVAVRRASGPSPYGMFQTERGIEAPEAQAGKALIVRHGDGTSRAWTIERAANLPEAGAALYVREEPGFTIDRETDEAREYQFPRSASPGPHEFVIDSLARSPLGRAADAEKSRVSP